MMLLKSGSCISQKIALERRGVARTYVILSVLGLAQLIDKKLDTVGRGAHEAQATQMAHPLAGVFIKAAVRFRVSVMLRTWGFASDNALGKVDSMVQESGLRGR